MADATKKLTHTAEELDAAVGMLLEVYTRDEIDDLLAQKITSVPGSGLITDDERDKLANLENYDDSEVKSQISLNRSTLGYQRKNLLKNTAASRTINGVTLTVNEDGSVTLNGTAAATVFFEIRKGMLLETGREYILSGCPVGGSTSSYALLIEDSSQGRTWDFGEGIKLTAASTNYDVKIRINANYTAENLTFRPMLRYTEITDDTYEPYKLSVEERLAVLEEKFAALEGDGT